MEGLREGAANCIGLSNTQSAGRDDIVAVAVAVERGRVVVRRDCSALQAAKMLVEGVGCDWQDGRGGERSILRAVEAFVRDDCVCASQESAEGRSMAGCVDAEIFGLGRWTTGAFCAEVDSGCVCR